MPTLDIELKNGQKAHVECGDYRVKQGEIMLSKITQYIATFPDGRTKELHFKPQDIFSIRPRAHFVKTIRIVMS